jgi:serine/threonine protein kinase
MGRGRMSLAEALRYATQIATCLRDLHRQGLVYGAVSSQLILLSSAGATLRSTGGLTHLGEGRDDVQAFGAIVGEMLRGIDGPEELCTEMGALAMRCQEETPDIRQVLVALRLLGMQARQGMVARRTPMPARSPKVSAKPAPSRMVRLRLRMRLHWRPLASLAAFALSGK